MYNIYKQTHLEFKYLIHGTYLAIEVNTAKDLGVFYDRNLNVHNHIDVTCRSLKSSWIS